MQVRRTLTKDGGKLKVGPMKTAKGRRTVKLIRDATEALSRHLMRQLEEIDGLGDYFQENGLVLAKAGLPHMRFHQLRHTAAATILLLKNVNPKIVSEMLGHASIAITLDTYSHVLPNMQDSAVAAMEEAYS